MTLTYYSFCGRERAHGHHIGYTQDQKYGCTGALDLTYSQLPGFPIEWEDPDPPSVEHASPKGVTWDQFQLFDPDKVPKENRERAQELAEWWMEQALAECRNLIPKAISYGSVDLDIMGEAMLTLLPQLRGVVPGQEIALAFYLQGKVSRIFGAYEQGVRPAEDSWDDSAIYARMARRVRETGKW